jgi:hypothetical protein
MHFSSPDSPGLLFHFKSKCLCQRCYAVYAHQRAREHACFFQVSEKEIEAKVSLLQLGMSCSVGKGSDKDRCITLLALGRLSQFAHRKKIAEAIAADLGLDPGEIGVRSPAFGSAAADDIKSFIISDLMEHRARHARAKLASMLSKAFWPALAFLACWAIWNAWK